MNKKFKGVVFLGIFFIFLGFGLLSVMSEIFSDMYGLGQKFVRLDQALVLTLEDLKYFDSQEVQIKLQASGNLEKFKREVDNFKQDLKFRIDIYKRLSSIGLKLQVVINLILGVFLLVSGFGLIVHSKWGRELSLWGIVGFCLYIVSLPLFSFYLEQYLMQYVTVGNKLNLLVDPTYKDLSIYAGKSAFESMLMVHGNVILSCVLISLFIVIGVWWYLTRPNVKARFV